MSATRSWIAATGVGLALMVGAGAAQARGDVHWSVGIGVPGVVVGASTAPPVYYTPPAPVYYAPPPPVYHAPRPVYYAPPVVVAPPIGYYRGYGHYHHHHRHDRHRGHRHWR